MPSLPLTITTAFGTLSNATGAMLDANLTTIYQAVNGIGNGSIALSNVTITGGSITNVFAANAVGNVTYPDTATANTFPLVVSANTVIYASTSQVPGTNTNDSAGTGNIAEYAANIISVANAVSLSTGSTANIASILLPAGDYELDGEIWTNPTGSTITSQIQASITPTSNTIATVPSNTTSTALWFAPASAGAVFVLPLATCRANVAVPTTYYLVTNVVFRADVMGAYGKIRYRRAR